MSVSLKRVGARRSLGTSSGSEAGPSGMDRRLYDCAGCLDEEGNMVDGKLIPLTQMQSGQSGMLAEIWGGHGFVNRLNALGLRLGRRITKISSMLMHGPITVQVDGIQIALGFGIARKVMVRLESSSG